MFPISNALLFLFYSLNMPRLPPRRHRPLTPATFVGFLSLILPATGLARHYVATHSLLPLAYTCIISIITFIFYGYDKVQARNLEWRVQEVTLHFLALIGGWPGALVGMHVFQHKTRKKAFLVPLWGVSVGWQGVLWKGLHGDQSQVTF